MVIEIPAYVNQEKNCAVCVAVLPKKSKGGVTKGKIQMDTSYYPYWVGGYGIKMCVSEKRKKFRGSQDPLLQPSSPNTTTPISHQKESRSLLNAIYVH